MAKNSRAQASIEYMLALAASVMLIAFIMVGGFKELEIQLALGAVRIGGGDFVSENPYYSLGRISYSTDEAAKIINVTPVFYLHGKLAATAQEQTDAANMSFVRMRQVFAPNNMTASADYCYNATYMSYCVSPILLPP
jgi:hypothetical protein